MVTKPVTVNVDYEDSTPDVASAQGVLFACA